MRTLARTIVLSFCCVACFAQSSKPPEFDVADIRPSDSSDAQMTGASLLGGQFSIRNASMEQLVKMAYGIHLSYIDNYLIGAPAWFGSDRFDIVGKAPPNSPNKI